MINQLLTMTCPKAINHTRMLALTNPDVELTTKIVIILSVAGGAFCACIRCAHIEACYQYNLRTFGITSLMCYYK